MKIYRGGQMSPEWTAVTDSITPRQLQRRWRPGGMLALDGTIQKGGERHSAVGVEIEAQDVVALVQALVAENQRLKEALASWAPVAQRLRVFTGISAAARMPEGIGHWTEDQVSALRELLDLAAPRRRGRASR